MERPIGTHDEVVAYIVSGLKLLTEVERSNIRYHLDAGHKLLAGRDVYKWSGPQCGCLVSFATSRQIMEDALDFLVARDILQVAGPRYAEILKSVGLHFYLAMQVLDSEQLTSVVLDFLNNSGR